MIVVMSDPKSRTGDQDKKDLMKLLVPSRFLVGVIDLNHASIHTNGGTCAQIATNQSNLFVVYGGMVTRRYSFGNRKCRIGGSGFHFFSLRPQITDQQRNLRRHQA